MLNQANPVEFEEGWNFLQQGITKLQNLVEGKPESNITSEDYMMLYQMVYNMCTQKNDYSQQLYGKYRESIGEYLSSVVLPSLQEKHDELMLRDFAERWSNHKVIVRWMMRFFHYLERYFIARRAVPGLNEVGVTCFRNLVYAEINGKVRDAVISQIDQEREGEQVDQVLLRNVIDIFVEIDMGKMDCYMNDFEAEFLKDTEAYYSRKASRWILENSHLDYMSKVEECLKLERDRVSNYLQFCTEAKLIERVRHALVTLRAAQLREKEHSECHAPPRDEIGYSSSNAAE